LWGGSFDTGGNYNDASNDYVRGGSGADSIIGGFAIDGVDQIYGGRGNDSVNAAQRTASGAPVTKEIVNCGPGSSDMVYFDRRKDVIRNCEIKREGTASSAIQALTVISAHDRGR
jgi:Ca2+-binding RTX toxin-like protein